jgi:hypothetical protein
MKTYEGVEIYLHAFLTSALDEGEWTFSRPSRFPLREYPPVATGQEAGWAPEHVLDAVTKRKMPAPTGNRTPVFQPAA